MNYKLIQGITTINSLTKLKSSWNLLNKYKQLIISRQNQGQWGLLFLKSFINSISIATPAIPLVVGNSAS